MQQPPAHELSDLLRHPGIWRGCDMGSDAGCNAGGAAQPALPTGYASLDSELPGGGWPVGVLTEIIAAGEGIGELRLVAPALARLCAQGKLIVWVAPPHLPYAPALAAAGMDLSRMVVVRATAADALWAMEQALRANATGAVLAWPTGARFTDLRRLQLAAEGRQALALLFRGSSAMAESSPAPLRMALHSRPAGLEVRIFKRRGRPHGEPLLLSMPPVVRRACHWNHRNVDALDSPASATPAAGDLHRLIHA